MNHLDRITRAPGVLAGHACIQSIRVTVGLIVGQIATARSIEELLHWSQQKRGGVFPAPL